MPDLDDLIELSDQDKYNIELRRSKRTPWNIFFERHSLLIFLLILSVATLFGSLFRVIFTQTMRSPDILPWYTAFLLFYLFLIPCIIFYKKYLFLAIGLTLFLSTIILVGIYPFRPYMTSELIKSIPFLTTLGEIIPLAELSEKTFAVWQVIYNTLIIPVTFIILAFYKYPDEEAIEYFYEKIEAKEMEKEMGMGIDTGNDLPPIQLDDSEHDNMSGNI